MNLIHGNWSNSSVFFKDQSGHSTGSQACLSELSAASVIQDPSVKNKSQLSRFFMASSQSIDTNAVSDSDGVVSQKSVDKMMSLLTAMLGKLQMKYAQISADRGDHQDQISKANLDAAKQALNNLEQEIHKQEEARKKAKKWGIFGKIFAVVIGVALAAFTGGTAGLILLSITIAAASGALDKLQNAVKDAMPKGLGGQILADAVVMGAVMLVTGGVGGASALIEESTAEGGEIAAEEAATTASTEATDGSSTTKSSFAQYLKIGAAEGIASSNIIFDTGEIIVTKLGGKDKAWAQVLLGIISALISLVIAYGATRSGAVQELGTSAESTANTAEEQSSLLKKFKNTWKKMNQTLEEWSPTKQGKQFLEDHRTMLKNIERFLKVLQPLTSAADSGTQAYFSFEQSDLTNKIGDTESLHFTFEHLFKESLEQFKQLGSSSSKELHTEGEQDRMLLSQFAQNQQAQAMLLQASAV